MPMAGKSHCTRCDAWTGKNWADSHLLTDMLACLLVLGSASTHQILGSDRKARHLLTAQQATVHKASSQILPEHNARGLQ